MRFKLKMAKGKTILCGMIQEPKLIITGGVFSVRKMTVFPVEQTCS